MMKPKNWRVNLTFVFFLLFSIVILGRLISLQIVQGDFYKALAQGLNVLPNEIQPLRGEIYLKNGESLAINKDFSLVFSSFPKITDIEDTGQKLAEALDLDRETVLRALEKDTLFSPIKEKLTDEEINKLKELNLDGIYVSSERGRYYPKDALASQLVGFLGSEGAGQYGLEEHYDSYLGGEEKTADLILTIDYNIQFKAEKLLQAAKENLSIEGGQIIVADPGSGKILALANFPNFNPNQYGEYASKGDLEIFKNGATQKFYEPGSVFKPITMAIALNEGNTTPQTTYVDEGKIQIGGSTIYNYDGRVYGLRTMTQVLEKSINTGAVFAERAAGHKAFTNYVSKFGIFESSGIDLPEVFSENLEFKRGYEINYATAAFGQGIKMTPIQLIRAYCAIANGGKLVRPYVVEEITDINESIKIEPKFSTPIISQKTSSQVTAMLISVVEEGFAKTAKIPGYYIAGKTGTAQIPWASIGIDKKGYSDKTWQSFIGFAPAFNPKFLILVKLDNPQTNTAEYSAMPVFRELAQYIIDYWQIPPDYAPLEVLGRKN